MMTGRLCDTGCGRPTRDGLPLCEQCRWELERDLGDVPALVEELDVTLARQDRIGQRGGKLTRGATRPLPYNINAGDVRRELTRVLQHWAGELSGASQRPVHPAQPDELARWLLARLGDLVDREHAADAHEQITLAVRDARRAVDRPVDRIYAGKCGTTVEPGPDAEPGDGTARGYTAHWRCEAPLYAAPGAPFVDCPDCAARHDVEARRDHMLREIDTMLMTISEIVDLAVYFGHDIDRERTRALLHKWAQRGRIIPHTVTDDGRAWYPFGDTVRAVLEARQNREAS